MFRLAEKQITEKGMETFSFCLLDIWKSLLCLS